MKKVSISSHGFSRRLFFALCLGLIGLSGLAFNGVGASSRPRVQAEVLPDRTLRPATILQGESGKPHLNFGDGESLVSSDNRTDNPIAEQPTQSLQPLGLASADFNEDGILDVISAHSNGQGGVLKLHRGVRSGSEQSFDPAVSFEVAEKPELLVTGDFNIDGRQDIVAARRGGRALVLYPGDGRGGFGPSRTFETDGEVTALVAGELGQADGLTDLAVGLVTETGARVAVFSGTLENKPATHPLESPATALAIGQIDDHPAYDLAIAAGNELVVVQGRSPRTVSVAAETIEESRPNVSKRRFQNRLVAVEIGNFSSSKHSEIAVADADGRVLVLDCGQAEQPSGTELPALSGESGLPPVQKQAVKPVDLKSWKQREIGLFPQASRLLSVTASGLPTDDLTVLGDATGFDVLNTASDLAVRFSVLDARAVSVLPMRLNGDALSDLVVLTTGDQPLSKLVTKPAATFTVINTADSGAGSLRQAIFDANASAGADIINFNIPGNGPHTISPTTPLPKITGPVTIDGYSQPGASANTLAVGNDAVLKIELSGQNIQTPTVGLFFQSTASGSTIKGLVVNRVLGGSSFIDELGSGIVLNGADNCVIEGNFIGTNVDGTAASSNASGVFLVFNADNNLIGGTTPAARNVVSGSTAQTDGAIDIEVNSIGNFIRNNYIGTNADGTAAVSNHIGVFLFSNAANTTVGGSVAGAGNLISGNATAGIYVTSSTNAVVQGNRIGTDASGTGDLGNNSAGLRIEAPNALIGGGTAVARNVISGNLEGIFVSGSVTTGTRVSGNFIGTTADGSAALKNDVDGVRFNTNTTANVLGTDGDGLADATEGNVVASNGTSASAFEVVIEFNATGTVVAGNLIGTDSTGTVDLGTVQGIGIQSGASANRIGTNGDGTSDALEGNVVAGSNGRGISAGGPGGNNIVAGNLVGMNAAGTAALPVTGDGIVVSGSPSNRIGTNADGTSDALERNVVGGNTGSGIFIFNTSSTGNIVAGNVVGANAAGTVAFPNGVGGIRILTASGNLVGGLAAGAGNLVAFNIGTGILVSGGTANSILGNSIHSNGQFGIDLAGGNQNQAAPTLTRYLANGTVQGTAPATGTGPFRIQIFANTTCDASGGGEGETFLGETTGIALGAAFSVNAGVLASCTPITATATDADGDTSEFSICFSADAVAPNITTCAPAQTVSASANCQATVPNFTGSVTASDNCATAGSLTITQSPLAGTVVGSGSTTVTITVRDNANNTSTCTTTFTVADTTPPTVTTCAPAQTANADADCLVPVPNFTGSVVASDNCTAAGGLTITQSPLAGTLAGSGVTTVTITVKDAANNAATCATTFTVADVTPPQVVCPPNQVVGATGPTGAVVNYPPATATDNCTALPVIGYSQNSGTLFPIGMTTVTVTATDAAGNPATCSFTVTVTSIVLPVTYAADTQNHRIQKFDGQNWTVILGTGVPGIGLTQTNLPEAVTANLDGSKLYVADTGNDRILFSTNGGSNWAVFASQGLGLNQVKSPQGLALDLLGNLYVADTGNDRVLRFAGGLPGNGFVLAGAGFGAGQVKSPRGLAVDAGFTLFIADRSNNRVLRVENAHTVAAANTGTIVASGPGIGLNQVNLPEGVGVDDAGNLYVADTGNNRVIQFPGGAAGNGVVKTNGQGGVIGNVNLPEGVTVSRFTAGPLAGQTVLIVGDTGNNRIQGCPLAAPAWQLIGAPNGIGSQAGQFRNPSKVR